MPPAKRPTRKPRRKWNPGEATARNRVLAEWRGIDLSAAEKARADKSKRAGDVLPAVLKEMRMDTRRVDAEIMKVWRHAINPNITEHAQPTGYRNGTLFVTVDSNAWLAEIVQWHRKEILTLLQNSFGREFIKRISFRSG